MLKLDFLPTQKNLPYWVAGLAFSAAGYAFAGWIMAERACAEREAEIQRQARAQIQQVVADCERDKQRALDELRRFVTESGNKYAALAKDFLQKQKK